MVNSEIAAQEESLIGSTLLKKKRSAAPGGPRRRRGDEARPLGGARIGYLVLALVVCLVPSLAPAAPLHAPGALAMADFQSGRFQKASMTLERVLRQDPGNASFQLLLARCYYELSDWDRAAPHAESAEKLEPQNARVHLWLGRIYGRQAEQRRSLTLAVRTRKEFERAVALDPSSIEARRDLMEFYLNAPWVLGGGKSKAKKQAQAIAAINPAAGAVARAHFDAKTGQDPEAAAEFRRAIDLKPDRVGPYLEAAEFFRSRDDTAGMAVAIAAAAKIGPSDPRLSYYRGVLDILQKTNLHQAERDLKSYLATAPHRTDFPSQASALSWLNRLKQ